jgi:hypothetical protein
MKVYWANEAYIRQLIERKELSFKHWRESGYRSIADYYEFIRLFKLIQSYRLQ